MSLLALFRRSKPPEKPPVFDPYADKKMYRDGITTLFRLKSKTKVTCWKPENIASATSLFFRNANNIVRIFEPSPNPEIYDDEDLIIEANVFIRRGGRIQFLHGPGKNRLIALLNNLETEGLLQAQTRTLSGPYTLSFATMDEIGFRSADVTKETSCLCANDTKNSGALVDAFMRAWTRNA